MNATAQLVADHAESLALLLEEQVRQNTLTQESVSKAATDFARMVNAILGDANAQLTALAAQVRAGEPIDRPEPVAISEDDLIKGLDRLLNDPAAAAALPLVPRYAPATIISPDGDKITSAA